MVGETNFFLGDIQFLQVINHLLFETILVDSLFGFVCQFVQIVQQMLADMLNAPFFIGLHFFEQRFDGAQFFFKHSLKGLAFLLAESAHSRQSTRDSVFQEIPFFVGKLFICSGNTHHIRKAQEAGKHFCRDVFYRKSQLRSMAFVVFHIIVHRLPVDRRKLF